MAWPAPFSSTTKKNASSDCPGEYEVPIVIQDRTFDDQNQLVYGGGMHARRFGF